MRETFPIVPKFQCVRYPFDAPGLNKKVTRKEIIGAFREYRERT
jgi:hypothetical protein